MNEPCPYSNPLRRDGTSQRQRSTVALLPSSVAVDERQLSDLLLYVRRYARLLRYYGLDDVPAGHWSDFLEHDPTTVASAVAETDPEDSRRLFEQRLADLAAASDKGPAFAALLPPILETARTFELWYRGTPAGLSLRHALERLISSVLRDALQASLAATARLGELSIPVETADPEEWSDIWEIPDAVRPDRSLLPSGGSLPDDEVEAAAGRMGRIFERFYEGLVFLTGEAPAHLAQTLNEYPRHAPHMALLLAFLQLLGHARDHLNGLTAAHLDFYYRTVLGLKPRPAEADRVHLLFELAKRFDSHPVAEDTVLKAGKDASGNELFYATDEELAVNRAVLDPEHGLKTIFVRKDSDGGVVNVHAAPVANSADGLGAEIDEEESKWPGLGAAELPYAELGFAVASPMLLLGEGTRGITLRFKLTPDSMSRAGIVAASQPLDGVLAYLSGEKQWLEAEVLGAALEVGISSLTVDLRLAAGEDPVVPYDGEVLGEGLETTQPVVKLVLDNTVTSYPYEVLRHLEMTALEIDVNVDGVRGLVLENDLGVLNPAKPFHPFGPVPKKGGSFLVGSPEVFGKRFTRLDFAVEWADLPDERFFDHYLRYTDANDQAIVATNSHFTALWSVLRDGAWEPLKAGRTPASLHLFETPPHNPGTEEPAPSANRAFSLEPATALPPTALPPDSRQGGFERFTPGQRHGFLRATLEKNFLHTLYPRLLAEEAATGDGTTVPNAPYTPLIASLTLDYEAATEVDYGSHSVDDFEDRVEQIFQLGPFGHREVYPVADTDVPVSGVPVSGVPVSRRLVPELEVTVRDGEGGSSAEVAEGTLLLGLEDFDPPRNLTLLFQMAEGSENPLAIPPRVSWSYLADDTWVDFETSEVLSDSTDSLLSSGIVRLAAPKRMSPARTVLPAGRHWIKASVAGDSNAIPQLIAVHTQAVAASFRDAGNDPSHLAEALPAETISKLKSRAAAVKSVAQPYSSFGGRREEDEASFQVRVSERLRHKGRAVTLFDYERLVLERFPEVYKVRCLNHTSPGCELAPGNVQTIVVANLRNKNAVDPLAPRLSLGQLETIRQYLAPLASDFVTLTVSNPAYEQVRVHFNVRFHSGRDKGLFTRQLDQDIVGFLSPWLVDEAADVALGGRVHRSAILDFVENRDYVDFVTDFRMDHIDRHGVERRDVEEAVPSSAGVVLVSAAHHEITHSAFTCRDLEDVSP